MNKILKIEFIYQNKFYHSEVRQVMQLLNMRDISMGFADTELFKFDKFEVWSGDKIGLVGANGSGKTTLLRLISGDLNPWRGKIERQGNWSIFRQFEIEKDEFKIDGESMSRWNLNEISNRTMSSYSGGEKTRMRLAEAFTTSADLLLLDEPTANLDLEGIEKLRETLLKTDSFILISHDRELLDSVTTQTIEISDGRIIDFPGVYSEYIEWKEKEFQHREREYLKYIDEKNRLSLIAINQKSQAQKMVKKPRNISSSEAKQRAFGAVGKSYGGKAKSFQAAAKHTEKRIEQLEKKEKPSRQFIIRPDFSLTDPPQNKIIIEATDLTFGYEYNNLIFKNARFSLKRNRRTALVGPNGCGKTTLFRLIEEAHQGIRIVPKAKVGILRQALDQIDLKKSLLENIGRVSIQSEEVNRNILARMGFPHTDVYKSANILSGGEKIKLIFAMLFVSDINVLLIDEPTNYLDIPSIEAIESLFLDFEGTMLFTSHDSHFINILADEIWVIEDQKIVSNHGNLSDFYNSRKENKIQKDDKLVLEIRKSQLLGELSQGIRPQEEIIAELDEVERLLKDTLDY